MTTPRLVLHIGLPKTGITLLQYRILRPHPRHGRPPFAESRRRLAMTMPLGYEP